MATGSYPTMLDIASRTDSMGNIADVVETQSQTNDWMEDAPYVEASEKTGHEFVLRSSIPGGAWRGYNIGTGYNKSTALKGRVGIGMLAEWSQVDASMLRHSGNGEKFRRSEDNAFIEGMGQTIARTLVYGNTTVNPLEFMGWAAFYNTLNPTNAFNAANVRDGGGVNSNNTSLWFIGWSPETMFMIYPRGSKVGMTVDDRGDVVPGYDSLGNPFVAFTTYFEQEVGFCPRDWRYGARIANLDVTNAGLAGPNAPDIFELMGALTLTFPKTSKAVSGIVKTDAPNDTTGTRRCWYGNRTMLHYMYTQAMRNKQVLLRVEDYAGIVTDNFRGDPIKVIDQITNTEARVV